MLTSSFDTCEQPECSQDSLGVLARSWRVQDGRTCSRTALCWASACSSACCAAATPCCSAAAAACAAAACRRSTAAAALRADASCGRPSPSSIFAFAARSAACVSAHTRTCTDGPHSCNPVAAQTYSTCARPALTALAAVTARTYCTHAPFPFAAFPRNARMRCVWNTAPLSKCARMLARVRMCWMRSSAPWRCTAAALGV
jgi:hypothetical protein